MAFDDRLKSELQRLQQASLYRSRTTIDGPQGVNVTIQGQSYLNFSSNDYLGLANHPKITEAFQQGIRRYGSGSGAAHLVSGHSHAHHALEEELADFTQRPRALLFSSGYMANLGCISALLQRGDQVLQDRLNHASLLDAGLLSGARHQRFKHTDIRDLNTRLQRIHQGEKLIISDGVFSMDGDIAPIDELAKSAQQHNGWLMIDDAHGLGVLGPNGEGSCHQQTTDILMGTLGKAFGVSGAFVAGSEDLIEYLIQKARPYLYTTALPAAIAEATRASLTLVKADTWRRQQLNDLRHIFHQEMQLALPHIEQLPSQTAILPLLIGSAKKAMQISHDLKQAGILATAIRPPTVPEGTSRIRITLSAHHQPQDIDQLIHALKHSWASHHT